MDIEYISIKENPADIITSNISEADNTKHARRITKGELWELVKTGRENVNNNRVMDGVTDCESTEYYSHALANTVNQENVNEWILLPRPIHSAWH